jgi:bifunctional non-homologous end joining protein LigD
MPKPLHHRDSHAADEQPIPGHQLLTSIDRAEMERLLADEAWLLQPKFDGVRVRLESRTGARPRGISRTGKPITLPQTVVDATLSLPSRLVLDGELIGDDYICFDLLQYGDNAIWRLACEFRISYIEAIWGGKNPPRRILPVVSAFGVQDKQTLYRSIHENGLEGVVFKRRDAAYSGGRPNSGGPALKFKFVNTCSVIVAQQRGAKRSVEIKLADDTPVGSVTIPPNQEIPKAGQIIEVEYLYRHDIGGDLIQAVYRGVRRDIRRAECTAAQLHTKGSMRMPSNQGKPTLEIVAPKGKK